MLDRGGDFADGCLIAEARNANCSALLTFDKLLAQRGGDIVQLVSPA